MAMKDYSRPTVNPVVDGTIEVYHPSMFYEILWLTRREARALVKDLTKALSRPAKRRRK